MQISLRNLRKLDCAGKPVPTFPHPALAQQSIKREVRYHPEHRRTRAGLHNILQSHAALFSVKCIAPLLRRKNRRLWSDGVEAAKTDKSQWRDEGLIRRFDSIALLVNGSHEWNGW
jgi:hypothetical protein